MGASPGKLAGITRAQLKKAKEQLARIDTALDAIEATTEHSLHGAEPADRVEALAAMLAQAKVNLEEREWEAAAP
jgi:thioester reductase-like protein